MKAITFLALVGFTIASPLKKSFTLQEGRAQVGYANGYIVGGVAATAGQIPYIVSLQRTSHYCGGTIIDASWILTAAHCVVGITAPALNVRYNTLTHNSGGTLVKVSNLYPHESFSSTTFDNDIALLQLATPLSLGSINAQKVTLPAEDSDVTVDDLVTVAGWGTTQEGAPTMPTELQTISVPVVSRLQCNAQYGSGYITDNMFCAGILGIGGQDSCQGDSGGPVTQGGPLVGVVSWGNGCARPQYPGVYTLVSNYISWIRSKGAPV